MLVLISFQLVGMWLRCFILNKSFDVFSLRMSIVMLKSLRFWYSWFWNWCGKIICHVWLLLLLCAAWFFTAIHLTSAYQIRVIQNTNAHYRLDVLICCLINQNRRNRLENLDALLIMLFMTTSPVLILLPIRLRMFRFWYIDLQTLIHLWLYNSFKRFAFNLIEFLLRLWLLPFINIAYLFRYILCRILWLLYLFALLG